MILALPSIIKASPDTQLVIIGEDFKAPKTTSKTWLTRLVWKTLLIFGVRSMRKHLWLPTNTLTFLFTRHTTRLLALSWQKASRPARP